MKIFNNKNTDKDLHITLLLLNFTKLEHKKTDPLWGSVWDFGGDAEIRTPVQQGPI